MHAHMLADEMKHRVKNVLTIASSIASQTFRGAETLDGALRVYSAPLGAMSRAQDLLTSSGEDSAAFRELVDQALRPYRSGEDWAPFEVDGPALPIAARMATAFSMALHELATNATKYWPAPAGYPVGMLVQCWRGRHVGVGRGRALQSWRTRPQRDLSAPGQDRSPVRRDIAERAMRAHGVEVLPPGSRLTPRLHVGWRRLPG